MRAPTSTRCPSSGRTSPPRSHSSTRLRAPRRIVAAATEYVLAPISAHGRSIGVLVLGRAGQPYTEAEADFGATAAEYLFDLAGAENATAADEQATSVERRRIAQELHDGLA